MATLLFANSLNTSTSALSFAARLISLIALVGTATAASASEDADHALFKPLDVFALEWANGPQVSPDGKTIAYTRSGFDIMKDRRSARIWLIDADGERHRPMTDRSGGAPQFSPDGDRVAFVSSTDEGSEVFMHWLADNRTARLTQLPESPRNLSWSPDGRQIAFTMFQPAAAKPMAKLPSAPKGAKWAAPFKVFEEVQYRADGAGYLRPGFTQVYLMSADGGAPRQLTSGNFNHGGGISWTQDGSALYVSGNRNDDWALNTSNTDIYRVDIADGKITAITERDGADFSPSLSPNGRYLAYLGFDNNRRGYENVQLNLLDLNSGETRLLAEDIDSSLGGIVWREDSRAIYFQYDREGMGHIARTSLSGKLDILADDLGGTSMSRPYSGGSFDYASGTLSYTRSVNAQPADLALAARGESTSLTKLNDNLLNHRDLAEVESFRVQSTLDGRDIQAWVAKPPGFSTDKRYPLILEIHGGPHTAYGPQFASEIQLMAAAGYVVVYANPRGSTSYGEEFANLIDRAYPGGDFDDLMSVVDHAIEAGWADPDRLFVTGGSGGGILTAWIVTHTDRFAAAVAAKPVINWYSFVLTADAYPFFSSAWFDKKPWEDPQEYLQRSPLNYIDQAKTPTMLLTGERDFRTPISESEQFYQALKLVEVDTALVRIPGASHGIASRPSQLIGKVAHILAWFERYDRSETDKETNGQ